jgi:hypothetical protein
MDTIVAALTELKNRRETLLIQIKLIDTAIGAIENAMVTPSPFQAGPVTQNDQLKRPTGPHQSDNVERHQKIHSVLLHHGPLSTRDVAKRIGEDRLLVKAALYRMLKVGRLTRMGMTRSQRWALP